MYCKVHSTLAKAGYACMYVVVLLLRSNSNKQARPSWNLHQFFNARLWLRTSSGGSRPSRALFLVSPQVMASNTSNGNTHQVPVGLDDYVGLRTQLAISQHAAQTASQTAQSQHPQPPPHAVAYPPPPRPPPPPYSGPYLNWNPHPYAQPRPPMGQASTASPRPPAELKRADANARHTPSHVSRVSVREGIGPACLTVQTYYLS